MEKKIYHQISKTYVKFELPLKKNDATFEDDNTDVSILVNNVFARLFKEAVM